MDEIIKQLWEIRQTAFNALHSSIATKQDLEQVLYYIMRDAEHTASKLEEIELKNQKPWWL